MTAAKKKPTPGSIDAYVRKNVIFLRLDDHENEAVTNAAKDAHMKPTAFARNAVLNAAALGGHHVDDGHVATKVMKDRWSALESAAARTLPLFPDPPKSTRKLKAKKKTKKRGKKKPPGKRARARSSSRLARKKLATKRRTKPTRKKKPTRSPSSSSRRRAAKRPSTKKTKRVRKGKPRKKSS